MENITKTCSCNIIDNVFVSKNGKFHCKFNMFIQNIDSGYISKQPFKMVLMSTHNLCFGSKMGCKGVYVIMMLFLAHLSRQAHKVSL